MNNVVESICALRILWGYVKCIYYSYNLKYLGVPIVYLLIILLAVPSTNKIINEISYKEMNSYTIVKELTKEDKINIILNKYKLTRDEFNVLSAIVLTEAEFNSYDDAYAVINTIYNRTHSKTWVKMINKRMGNNKGNSLYYQAIAPRQFVVYEHGSYKKNLGNTESAAYDAIIDFLYTEEVMHNYLSFRAHSIKIRNSEAFSEKGNNYFNVLTDKNRIFD